MVKCSYFTTQSTASFSINSTADGLLPSLKIAETASQASSSVGKEANNNKLCLGCGISLKTILVMMAKVPSEPIIKCVKLYPEEYFKVLDPVQIISPLGKTISIFKT